MKYKRLLLKISGEALQNRGEGLNHDPDIMHSVTTQFATLLEDGAEIAVVVGVEIFLEDSKAYMQARIVRPVTTWVC